MHDFQASRPEEMYFKTLRNSVSHYKREPEGKAEMESLIREFYSKEIAEAAEQARQETLKQAQKQMKKELKKQIRIERRKIQKETDEKARKEIRAEKDNMVRVLLRSGWTAQKIKEAVDLPISEIEEMERTFLEESRQSLAD